MQQKMSPELAAGLMARVRRFLDFERQPTSDTFGYYKILEVLQLPLTSQSSHLWLDVRLQSGMPLGLCIFPLITRSGSTHSKSIILSKYSTASMWFRIKYMV